MMRTRAILVFIAHQFAATWGVGVAAATLAFFTFEVLRLFDSRLFTPHNASQLLTALPYFPMQIIMGFWFGWSFSRRFKHRSMLWVWVLPLLILSYAVIAIPTLSAPLMFTSVMAQTNGPQSPLSHYFGWGCRPQDRCIDQSLVTMPFYASVAYSTGALLARKASSIVHFVRSEPTIEKPGPGGVDSR